MVAWVPSDAASADCAPNQPPWILLPSPQLQVKLWAKQHDINNAHCGTLNSWSLALMVLFSLQTYPQAPGALLPPLWRLFWDEEPSGAGGKGRPLQVRQEGHDAGRRVEGLLAGHHLLTALRVPGAHGTVALPEVRT